MDEGKPTKAKWWSRPRPETPAPPTAPPPEAAPQPGAAAGQEATPHLNTAPEPGAAPHLSPASEPGAAPHLSPASEPSAAPHPGAAPGQGAVPHQTGTPAPGAAPAQTGTPAPGAAPAQGAVPQQDAAPAQVGPPTPSAAPAQDAAPAQTGIPAPGTGLPGGVTAPADRPRPLHDPDPYSTPPYGEPGPWAPAPPVQHPATTPTHGTLLPPAAAHGATPAHGTPAGPAPAHGTPAALGHGATPPHGTPTHPAPAHGAPLPPAAPHASSTPPHGTPAPPGADVSAPAPYGGVGRPHEAAPHAGHPQGAQGAVRLPYDPWNAPLQQNGSLPPEAKERQRKRGRRLVVAGIALIALMSGLIGGALGSYLERNGVGDIELPQAGAEPKDRPSGSVAGIAAAALPGVVTLHVSGDSAQGTGTGFVLDGKGHILTNNHVVEPAGTGGEITVTFSSGDTAEAEVIGRDSGYDLAVVKVDRVRGLKPLTLGNSENVQVGDPVVAIGAPFDLANTVTSGIISAKERPITAGGEKGDGSDVSYVDALQTDAPINPGNSGGPLVDSKARVIGINSAIRSADEGSDSRGGQAGSIGLGFAIPINQGKRVAEELINFGKATHPVIGVTLDTEFTGDGARIAEKGKDGGPAVNANGPGDKAGLKPGDTITEVNGAPVHSSDELIVKVRAHRPKDRLDLTIERDGRDREVTLVLGSAHSD
ncbi:protease [Streptomyces sp. WAC 01529]|uniref:S1C family serine protease n=1 Tax=Streptomyces sp. WAC 01529 TaxID=2203205 RepID=UPI000F6F34E2|nr:trypsin-like peptidase domain-containing protein [Streptomyces sp. WAC 01529]AZM55365.1 protease [Streptomyces sp. WAC 01529]